MDAIAAGVNQVNGGLYTDWIRFCAFLIGAGVLRSGVDGGTGVLMYGVDGWWGKHEPR